MIAIFDPNFKYFVGCVVYFDNILWDNESRVVFVMGLGDGGVEPSCCDCYICSEF